MLTELPHLNVLSVSGEKAAELLQGQITADIRKVSETRSAFSALCNHKGQILSLFYVIKKDAAYLMVMDEGIIPTAKKTLEKYAPFYKVKIHEESFMCVGANADVTVTSFTNSCGSTAGSIKKNKCDPSVKPRELATLCTMNDPWTVEISIPNNANRKIFILKKNEKDTEISDNPANLQAWHNQNLEAGIPRLYPDTVAIFTPHQLSLEKLGAISFDKGCYTGQEIIARTHYLGKKTHQLFDKRVVESHPLKPGEFSQALGGTVVDVLKMNDQEQRVLITGKKDITG